jgi:queuine tRNA-ribosyltransferase
VLTDSGGFQVFSLGPAVDDDGVTFRSTYDGSTHRLSPEDAVCIQERLGADIQMALDVCTGLPAPHEVVRHDMERTLAWAGRARAAHRREDQAIFGIVQGGTDLELRAESARRTAALGFDGYGIGGLSVGETRGEMLSALEAALAELPEDRPRYLMGVGDPVGLVEGVARGVDQFDCVLPTRLGRHGTVLTSAGRVQLRRADNATDDGPLDPACACAVCHRWSRAYLRHLVMVDEPVAARLVTIHNLAFILALMARIRAAVADQTLDGLRAEIADVWGGSG